MELYNLKNFTAYAMVAGPGIYAKLQPNHYVMIWVHYTTHYYCHCNRSEVRCKKSALKPSTQIILFCSSQLFENPSEEAFWFY